MEQSEHPQPVRYVPTKQQEIKSLNQIEEALDGWPCNRTSIDLGEDMLVQIFDEGKSSGLSFYIQAKSVANLDDRVLKTRPKVPYELETKDIKHWEDFNIPVVLVVWDIKARKGGWLDIKSAIQKLDKDNDKWRTQDNVTVHLPLRNLFDEHSGKDRLRTKVARLSAATLTSDKPFDFTAKFRFPDDEEGRSATDALRNSIETGAESVIPGKYASVAWGPRFIRAYGNTEQGPLHQVTVSGPAPSKALVDILVFCPGLEHQFEARVPMAIVQEGTRQRTFEGKARGIHLKMVVPLNIPPKQKESLWTITFSTLPTYTMSDSVERIQMHQALVDAGYLKIKLAESANTLGVIEASQIETYPAEELERDMRMAKKLVYLDDALSRYGKLDPQAPEGDIQDVDALIAFSQGKTFVERRRTILLTTPRDPSTENKETSEKPASPTIHGVTYDLGSVKTRVLNSEYVVPIIESARANNQAEVEVMLEWEYELIEWGKPKKRRKASTNKRKRAKFPAL